MDSLRIRSAASEDAPTLARLLDQLGYPTTDAAIPQRIEKLHARPGTAVFVAEHEHGDAKREPIGPERRLAKRAERVASVTS